VVGPDVELHLRVENGRQTGRVFQLPVGAILVVGREPSPGFPAPDPTLLPDIRLPMLSVGRRHCQVRVVPDGLWVRDLDSRSGVWLNGRQLPSPPEEHWARPGDVLMVGGCRLRLWAAAAVQEEWLRWNGGTVGVLARHCRERQDFAPLPLLADALEDAGCTDAGILGHFRGGGEHARGCWLVDLLATGSPGPAGSPAAS
jgi:hypothetical protein